MSTASRSIPHTSFWCWSQAPLPTRTGREFAPARQVVEGVLGQVLPPVDAVHDLQVEVAAAPRATASSTKAKYSSASQSNPSRYSERSMNEESRIQV